MAGRTSSSLGVGIAITILSVLTLTLFVTTTVYFGKFKSVQQKLTQIETENEAFVKGNERDRDDVRTLLNDAKASKQSLVSYLADSLQNTMQKVTGSKRDTVAKMNEKLKTIPGADAGSLVNVISDRDGKISQLEAALVKADGDRKTALADQQNEGNRLKDIESAHAATVASLGAEVEKYKKEVETFRDGINAAKTDMDQKVERTRREARDRETDLQAKIDRLQDESLVLQEQLRKFKNKNQFRGTDEYALVDGNVIGLPAGGTEAIISVGRKHKVQLGMTFAVYSEATQIRPSEQTGDYKAGKATLEVIRVNEDSSVCRITSETKGTPVVRGDVIANAVYDPNKVYKFVVYGNFDINRDGIPSANERADVAAIVEGWGGIVGEDLVGDVDFLVLGERPILPPKPGPEAPIEVVQEFLRLSRLVERYDELEKQARATSLPILNENRLYTLIGKTPAPAR